jgi:hypothetical protein
MSAVLPMSPKPLLSLLAVVALAVTLPACERARQSLGLGKNPPDEFKIVSRAPLTVPNEFTLPEPKPGQPRPQELQPQEDAEVALFGSQVTNSSGEEISPGEEAIILTAEIEDDEVEDIRNTIDQEHSQMQIQATWVDDVLFWKDVPDPTEILIDPQKETERLQNNAALGLPANEGDFLGVVIIPREKAIFEDIF